VCHNMRFGKSGRSAAAGAQLRVLSQRSVRHPQCSAPGLRAVNAKGSQGDHHDPSLGHCTMTKVPAGLLVADELAVAEAWLVVRVVRTEGVLAVHWRLLL
jgi:hypothetical protein